MKKLIKSGSLTDIHWGAKSNSELHNKDCLRFIDWFCEQIKKDPTIDHINFLGDWFESRSALNVSTLSYADEGMRRLRSLNLPIFFIIGNHDLYHRHTREIFSPIIYKDYENVNVIDKPVIFDSVGSGSLYAPYLFHEEYPDLAKYLNLETWWGHFEFQGFIVTGYNIVMPVGPRAVDFKGPKHIISGHFHKRQAHDNIVYMGNVMPTTFNDADDNNRGMMTYDHNTGEMLFYNWPDCPKYTKTTLTDLLDRTIELHPDSRVRCLVDIPISFEESTMLRQKFTEDYQLREFTLEDSGDIKQALSETKVTIDLDNDKLSTVNDLVMTMLRDIESEHINNQKLVEIYQQLSTPDLTTRN